LPYYKSLQILKCPSDIKNPATGGTDKKNYPADAAPRSYIANGWNDYFKQKMGSSFRDVESINGQSLPEAAIPEPSMTVVYGEKRGDGSSHGHFYMDLLEGSGNQVEEVERGRHSNSGKKAKIGGSNYTFADGSARFVKYGQLLYPLNLWALTDFWRNNKVLSN
jgi:prepilin-type processing-associated H-X9-DG protein